MRDTLVGSIYEINPGDHVYFKRSLYEHHAIVEEVDYHNGDIKIIDYGPDPAIERAYNPTSAYYLTSSLTVSSLEGAAVITRKTVRFLDENFRKVIHNFSLSAREVIRRARSRIGETAYNLVANNCEHFANWCKEGKDKSEQAEKLVLGVEILVGIGFLVGAVVVSLEKNSKKK